MSRRPGSRALGAIGLAGSIVAMSVLTAAAQTPARDVRTQAPPPGGTAAIRGMVVTGEGNGRPVRLAYVVIIGSVTGVLRVTSSDGDGRFAFTSLPADRYLVGASKAPFLGSVAGARRPARPGTPIAIADGATIADVTIRLPLGASIAGAIVDERGQPATNALMGLQRRRLQGSERVLVSVPGANVLTDDRGRYRFHSLPPGEYVVVALRLGAALNGARVLTVADVDAALKGNRVPLPPPVDPNATPAPVYFPGTTRESDATLMTLAAGEERQNVDFRLELVRSANLEGTVVTGDGPPPANLSVTLATAAASSPVQSNRSARVAPDGRFVMPSVPPGSYTLVAREAGPLGRFASAPVEIAGVDQSGLQLTLRPPLTMPARIVFEGTTSPPALAGRRVPIRNLTPGASGAASPQVSVTNPAGAFSVTGLVPGQYVLGGPLYFGATADSIAWALQSVVADGRDVTDLPIAITADAVPKDVVVTFGDRWQALSGRLRQSTGAAAADYTIVIFPADRQYWLPASRRIVIARPGTDGQFQLGGPGPITLPPGDYFLAAVTDLDRDEQFDPALLASLVASAVPVTLQPGERKQQDVILR